MMTNDNSDSNHVNPEKVNGNGNTGRPQYRRHLCSPTPPRESPRENPERLSDDGNTAHPSSNHNLFYEKEISQPFENGHPSLSSGKTHFEGVPFKLPTNLEPSKMPTWPMMTPDYRLHCIRLLLHGMFSTSDDGTPTLYRETLHDVDRCVRIFEQEAYYANHCLHMAKNIRRLQDMDPDHPDNSFWIKHVYDTVVMCTRIDMERTMGADAANLVWNMNPVAQLSNGLNHEDVIKATAGLKRNRSPDDDDKDTGASTRKKRG